MSRSRRSTRASWFKWACPTAYLAFGIALAFYPLNVRAQIVESQPAAAQPAAPSATASVEQTSAATTAPKVSVSKPYYVEFRSRSARSYGHTFLIHGRLNANGRIASKTVVGLHPATESSIPWMIGHFVLVPSETGASDGDTEDQYVTARFQVAMSADEYRRFSGFVKELKGKSPVWHAVLYNCNAFIGDIARFMGMETPSSTMLMPAEYINGLRDLNISKTGLIGTPVRVVSAERLRTEALRAGGKKKDGTAVERPATPSDSGTTSEGAAAASRAAAPSAAGASPGSGRAKPAPRGPASNKDSEPKRKLSGVAPDNVDRPNLSPSSN